MWLLVKDRMYNLNYYDRVSIVTEKADDVWFGLVLRHNSGDSDRNEYLGSWSTYEEAYKWFNNIRQKIGDKVFQIHS